MALSLYLRMQIFTADWLISPAKNLRRVTALKPAAPLIHTDSWLYRPSPEVSPTTPRLPLTQRDVHDEASINI